MLKDHFDLQWPICRDGYRIDERRRKKKEKRPPIKLLEDYKTKKEEPERRSAIILSGESGGMFIVAKSDRFDIYEPFTVDGLWGHLADTEKTPEGVCKFVNAFGMPWNDREEAPVSVLYEYVDQMRVAVALRDAGEWKKLADGMWQAALGSPFGGVGRLSTVLLPYGERPRLVLRPNSLMSAIWLQFAADISEGANLKRCEWCDTPFYYGTGTGRRSTAVYCSTRCQKAHYRQRKEARQ